MNSKAGQLTSPFLYAGIQNRSTKLKLLRVSLGLQITRAPPWRFLPKTQSCLAPPLRPPINILPAVKLLTSG